jgi:hypothetical protein
VIRAACAALVACAACAHTPSEPAPLVQTTGVSLDVDVAFVGDDRDRVGAVELSLCPRDDAQRAWPRRVGPEDRRALRYLVSASDSEGRALEIDADGVRTRGVVGCARIVVDVGAMADAIADKDAALRFGDDVLATPDVWLWRPEPFTPDARLYVRFVSGPFTAFVPWARAPSAYASAPGSSDHADDARFVVDAATFRLKSDAALGRFTVKSYDVAGAILDVAVLGDNEAPAAMTSWLLASARAVATLSGRFPVKRVGVMLVAEPAPRPVLIGYFSRGGGPMALFFVASHASELVDDTDLEATGRWALTHELAHAWLPPTDVKDAWFNEGLATWHQDLLARRAGLIADDATYWRGLLEGLETGRMRAATDGLTLQQASAHMHEHGSFQHAYWAGVALILIAEVEARAQGASVDDVVLALRRLFPVDDRQRSARELLTAAEREGGPVAVAARAWLGAYEREMDAGFPDTRAVLAQLGVVRGPDGVVTFDDDAPLAHVRRALTTQLVGASS